MVLPSVRVLAVACAGAFAGAAAGASLTWTGSGDWYGDATNWSGLAAPGPRDDAVIGGSVTLTQSTAVLNSLTNLGQVLFRGTGTWLRAREMHHAGVMTHAVNEDGSPPWEPTHRVALSCSNLLVTSGGTVHADHRGFQGVFKAAGNGPGGGAYGGGGGSYGGTGGKGGTVYGSADQALQPGSAGGGAPNDGGYAGGQGGGVVVVEAAGTVTVNGLISVNGETKTIWAGGGSGGGLRIACRVLAGTGGVLRANGGGSSGGGAGGGGGRIAIQYDRDAQAAAPLPDLDFDASAGKTSAELNGQPGTIYLPDTAIHPGPELLGGAIVIPGFLAWTTSVLQVSGGLARFPDGFQLVVLSNLECVARGGLQLGASSNAPARAVIGGDYLQQQGWMQLIGSGTNLASLEVAGDAALAAGGRWYLFAENGTNVETGAALEAGGVLRVESGCTVFPGSHAVMGGSAELRCRSFLLEAGATVDAGGSGYGVRKGTTGYGPGAGGGNSGGGHGGPGGNSNGGGLYGVAHRPVQPGSGGGGAPNNGGTFAGPGGGAIRILAEERLTVDGVLDAGGAGTTGFNAGGGSGGSIYLECRTFAGSNGVLRADGGSTTSGSGGGGGGGRIAVLRRFHRYTGTPPSVLGGTGAGGNGGTGTVVFVDAPRGSAVRLH